MENITKLISKELHCVDQALALFLKEKNDIFNSLNDFLTCPSKRIRSTLAILYLKSFNIQISADIINVLCIGELIHNASLLHDDVLDDAELRRGQQTLAKQYSSKIAILCGDFLLATATKKLALLNKNKITDLFQNCTLQMCNAEIKQYSLRGKISDTQTYLEICEGKTAALFIAILKSVALITNQDLSVAESLAKNFGILFQLKNDVDKTSAETDRKNQIYTLKDILGIEKTLILTDNYTERVKECINLFPKNIYTQALESLLNRV